MKKLIFILVAILLFLAGCAAIINWQLEQRNTNFDTLPVKGSCQCAACLDVEKLLEILTIEEKIGQLIMAGFNGTTLEEELVNLMQVYRIGGLVFFERNIQDAKQLSELLTRVKEYNLQLGGLPLFLSVDEEGGWVTRLPAEGAPVPSAREIGLTADETLSYNNSKMIAERLQHFGFNMNFAPVLDIHSNPDNTVIGDRSYGSSANLVSLLGAASMRGFLDAKVIPVIKHFPGHGDTTVDSHYDLPIVDHSVERLRRVELKPFIKAIDSGAPAVMTAHILFPALNGSGLPATLSYDLLTGLLRRDMGFGGVIITDDLEMGAIVNHYGIEEAAVQAIQAGADILLVCHTYDRQLAVLRAVEEAVETGRLPMERINESVIRILTLKQEYGLFQCYD